MNFIMLAVVLLVCLLVLFIVILITKRLTTEVAEKAKALELAKANEKFRREFTADVAHELKTPLTSILGATEMMAEGVQLTEEERNELLAIIHEQSSRLSSLVKDILSLAQLEREEQSPRDNFAPVPLSEVVETAVALAQPQASAKGVEVCVAHNDSVTVLGDAHLLEQALGNLIENALRYSGSSKIEVSLIAESSASHALLMVKDYGVGIPQESIPHLFKRFYRVDKARSRTLGGTGLGLAIVKHIALLHGGEVSVSSIQGLSTEFTMRLQTHGN